MRCTLLASMLVAVSSIATPVAGADPIDCPKVFSGSFRDEIAARYPGRVITAHVYDIATGCSDTLNPGTIVTTASVHKIEILAGVLLEAQAKGRRLSDLERERATAMIRYSANTEASQLRNGIGGTARMAQLDVLFGMDDTVATDPWGATPTTARDQVLLARRTLLDENGPLRAWAVDVMWDLMTDVTPSQQWGISSGVPHGWTVALKNGFYPAGSGPWRINSSGVVSGPGGAGYALTILTFGWPSMSPGILAVEQVARHVAERLTPGDPACDHPTIVGTSGDDRLVGTPGDDVIAGRAGNDVISGMGGADVICGGKGNDELRGGSGRDVLRGGGGADVLIGRSSDDALVGGRGGDTLRGGKGRDGLRGGSGGDVLAGGRGGDHLHGGDGPDSLDGGDADDLLVGGGGRDGCSDPGTYEVWLVWAGCEQR